MSETSDKSALSQMFRLRSISAFSPSNGIHVPATCQRQAAHPHAAAGFGMSELVRFPLQMQVCCGTRDGRQVAWSNRQSLSDGAALTAARKGWNPTFVAIDLFISNLDGFGFAGPARGDIRSSVKHSLVVLLAAHPRRSERAVRRWR